jgi:hypothetical protein
MRKPSLEDGIRSRASSAVAPPGLEPGRPLSGRNFKCIRLRSKPLNCSHKYGGVAKLRKFRVEGFSRADNGLLRSIRPPGARPTDRSPTQNRYTWTPRGGEWGTSVTEDKRMPHNRYASCSTTLALLLAIAVAMLAGHPTRVWANPVLNPDFTADILSLDPGAAWTESVSVEHPGAKHGLNRGITGGGDMFVDHTGQRLRFKLPDRDIFIYYNDRRYYEISARTGRCRIHVVHGETPDIFEWLQSAIKLSTFCYKFMDSGRAGEQYELRVDVDKSLEFCGSPDQRTPYWVGWRSGDRFAWVEFKTYNPGRPVDEVFDLPDSCPD